MLVYAARIKDLFLFKAELKQSLLRYSFPALPMLLKKLQVVQTHLFPDLYQDRKPF